MSYENESSATSSVLSQLQYSLDPNNPLVAEPIHPEPVVSSVSGTVTNGHGSPEPELIPSPVATQEMDLNNEELFPALKPSSAGGRPKPFPSFPVTGYAPKTSSKGGSIPVQRNVTERFEIPSNLQAKQLGQKTTVGDVCKQITKNTGTAIEFSTVQRTGTMFFLVTGKPEDVKDAKRQVIKHISKPMVLNISIPASVRPHLVGQGGKNLKALIARTMTTIDIPKGPANSVAVDVDADEDEEQPVIITGDFEGVEMAKKEIEDLVSKRAAKYLTRIQAEYSLHAFIRRDLPVPETVTIEYPYYNFEASKKNELVLRGDRIDVLATVDEIKSLIDRLQQTTTVVQIDVNKRQHKFVIGQHGSVLQEIFESSGCSIDVPSATDPAVAVKIRGSAANLPVAMSLVLDKSNSVQFVDVPLSSILPSDTRPDLFMRYINMKERSMLKNIEVANNVTIVHATSSSGASVLEVQAKSLAEAEKAASELRKAIITFAATLVFIVVEIPRFLHRFAVGKGGQNITKMKGKQEWEGRFIDALFAHENEESDEVVIIVNRVGKEDPVKFVQKVRDELIASAQAMEDFVSETIKVEQKYHGRLIGSGGATVKELKGEYSDSIQIKFPPSSSASANAKKDVSTKKDLSTPTDPDSILLRGPKKEVNEVKGKILALVAEWKHSDTVLNETETFTLPKGIAKRMLAAQAPHQDDTHEKTSNTTWLARAVKEQAEHEKLKLDFAALTLTCFRVDITDGPGDKDNITIQGPRGSVAIAKKIMLEKGKKLADFTVVETNLFDAVSPAAKKLLSDECSLASGDQLDVKKKILRRVIGREGRLVKKLSEKHDVAVRFLDGRKRSEVSENEEETLPDDGMVVIKGSKRDVEAARIELVEFVENEILNSFILVFQIPSSILPYVIGRNGSIISKIKDDHAVRIDFNDISDSADVEVTIEGVKAKCVEAKKAIDSIVTEKLNTESLAFLIPAILHKVIIGSGGSRIKKVIEHFGGQEKLKIQFPRTGASGNIGDAIAIRGNKNILPLVRNELEKLLREALIEEVDGTTPALTKAIHHHVPIFESEAEVSETGVVEISNDINYYGKNAVVEIYSLPKEDAPRNNVLKELMKTHGAAVIVLPQVEGEKSVSVKIVAHKGSESVIDVIKKEIQAQIPMSSKVAIPTNILNTLRSSGVAHDAELTALNDAARRLKSDHGVSVEISQHDGVFIIRGEQKKCEKATAAAELVLAELGKHTATDQLQIAQYLRPHIIGRMGATINKIREQSGAHVELRKSSSLSQSDIVLFRGDAETVAFAKVLVEEIVAKQEERMKTERVSYTGNGSSQNSPAVRIDDSFSDVASNSSINAPKHIPGYSKKSAEKLTRPATLSSPSVLSSASNAVGYLPSPSKLGESEWKSVKSKKPKKGGEDDTQAVASSTPAVVVPGSTETPKKKKKNKSKSAVATSTDSAAPVSITSLNKVPEALKTTVAKPKVTAEKVETSKKVSQVTEYSTQEAAIIETVLSVQDVATPAVEDGWQTVKKTKQQKSQAEGSGNVAPVGSVPSAAAVLVDESAGKKKKNKKKKPAASNGSTEIKNE